MKHRYRMKEVLEMAPMDQCTLPMKSPQRAWWRYGWAHGFLGSNIQDVVAPVTCKSYRDAVQMGYLKGKLHRFELDAGDVGA